MSAETPRLKNPDSVSQMSRKLYEIEVDINTQTLQPINKFSRDRLFKLISSKLTEN